MDPLSNDESNPYASSANDIDVEVREPVEGELASLGLRFVGSLIDSFLAVAVVLPFGIAAGIVVSLWMDDEPFVTYLLEFIGVVFGILGTLAIHGYLLATNGQTVGKWLLRMKIVSDDGHQLGFANLFFKRYVIIILLSCIPIVGNVIAIIDSLMIFRSSRKCLHDDFAQTKVIKLP